MSESGKSESALAALDAVGLGRTPDALRGAVERLAEEVTSLREENRCLLIEYRAAAALLRQRDGEAWLRGEEPSFGVLLARRLRGLE